jgi:hypothetical protein
MKHVALFCTAAMFFAVTALAQDAKMEKKAPPKAEAKAMTLKGYVVDAMCAKGMAGKDNTMEKAAKHTKNCALEEECAASGFGIFSDGKWYKFDDAGDKQAKEMIEKSSRTKGLMFEVSGQMKDQNFALASMKEVNEETKMGKPEKKMEHDHDGHNH